MSVYLPFQERRPNNLLPPQIRKVASAELLRKPGRQLLPFKRRSIDFDNEGTSTEVRLVSYEGVNHTSCGRTRGTYP